MKTFLSVFAAGLMAVASPAIAQTGGAANPAQTKADVAPAGPNANVEKTAAERGTAPDANVTATPSSSATVGPMATPGAAAPADINAPAKADAGQKGSYVPMKPTPGIGQPVDGAWQLQPQVTATGRYGRMLNDAILMPIITFITLLVLGLLIYVVARFRRGANPTPSKTAHNTLIEVIWTVVPVLVLLGVAIPSIKLVAKQYQPAPKDAVTVKVTGYQWYWGYQYPDNGGFEVISKMLPDDKAHANGEPSHLATDNRMVIPAGRPIKLLITGADVIHSWAVPAFWTKMDAVPGRINEVTFTVDRPGVYYGQCSELCGVDHGYMPIAVEVLPQDKFDQWVLFNGGTLAGAAATPAAGAATTIAAPAASSDSATTGAGAAATAKADGVTTPTQTPSPMPATSADAPAVKK